MPEKMNEIVSFLPVFSPPPRQQIIKEIKSDKIKREREKEAKNIATINNKQMICSH